MKLKRQLSIIKPMISVGLLCMTLIMLIVGCTEKSAAENIVFPVRQEPETATMLTEIGGFLTIEDNYLRVVNSDKINYIIIWPYNYSYKAENENIQIINDKGKVVAKVDDYISVVGGICPAEYVEEITGMNIPRRKGPFWLASPIIMD